MLAQIFGSNARVKILKTFLSKPEQKYYTRQLARDLELQVNSVRRELENLQNIGLLKQEENTQTAEEETKTLKNDKKYFVVDRSFLLFNEMKGLFAKANLLSCQGFLKDIGKTGEIKHLWLSGLFTGDTSSPIDILVVGKIKKDQFLKRLQILEADLNKEINYTFMDESEFQYRMDINDIFLHRILQSRHLKVIGDNENNNNS